MATRIIQKHLPDKFSIKRKRWTAHRYNEIDTSEHVKNIRPRRQIEKDIVELEKSVPPHSHEKTDVAEFKKSILPHPKDETDTTRTTKNDLPHLNGETDTAGNVSVGLKRKREFDDTRGNNKRKIIMAGLQSEARAPLPPHLDLAIQPRDINCEPMKTRAQTNLELANGIETHIADQELKWQKWYWNKYRDVVSLWKQKKPYIENTEKRQWFMRKRLQIGKVNGQRLAAPCQNNEIYEELSRKPEETVSIVWRMVFEFRNLTI